VNKLLFLLLLVISFLAKAADSLVTNQKKPIRFSEKDIKVDDQKVEPIHFDPNYKSKYNSSEFQYEFESTGKSWWDRFVEWLEQLFKDLFGLSDGVSSTAVDWTVNTIATLIVLFVIYLIVKSILNEEGQWIFGKSTTKKIISSDDIERNLKYIDFEKLIKDTLKSGDNRLVIRYYYLWILKRMSEKSIIEWIPEKTNSDYLYEIKSDTLKKDFGYVSYLYNYIWYGEFDLDDATFSQAIQSLEKTLKSV
jgi:hypothetical protein